MSFSYARNVTRIVVSNLFLKTSYSRWAHRKPARVLLPFERKGTFLREDIIDLTQDKTHKDNNNKQRSLKFKAAAQKLPQILTSAHQKKKQRLPINAESVNIKEPPDKNDVQLVTERPLKKVKNIAAPIRNNDRLEVFDENNEIIYEKCKDNDGKISALLVKLKSRKDRKKKGQVMVEGWRLIVDGLEAKCKLRYIIFSRKEDLDNLQSLLPKTGVKIYKIPYREIEMWSSVETPSGVIGVFDIPSPQNVSRSSKPFPMQIICDNIRVPGNLGAILRTAAGAGCERVLLTKGCVDVWDPKVIRGAAGSHFRIPVHDSLDWEEIPKLVDNNSTVLVADSNTNNAEESDSDQAQMEVQHGSESIPLVPYYGIEYASFKYVTVIIGGETEGISEDSYRFAAARNGFRINIPLQKGVDSLNTGLAAAVILFEIKKQLLQAYTKIKQDRDKMYGT